MSSSLRPIGLAIALGLVPLAASAAPPEDATGGDATAEGMTAEGTTAEGATTGAETETEDATTGAEPAEADASAEAEPTEVDASPEAEPAEVDASPHPELDARLDARLEAIYAELPALVEVEVEVVAGVVHLSGTVFELDASDEAEAIARGLDGVVAVDNGIEQNRVVGERLGPLATRLREGGAEIVAFIPVALVGLAIVVLAWLLAHLVGRSRGLTRRLLPDRSNSFLRELGGQLVRAGIIVLGIVLALELMGATTLISAVLGTAGVVGLALGFAFKDTAENYIASVLLSLRKPFEPNDLVSVAEHTGRVVRLTSRATILLTLDGNHVRIPNATVFKATIVNYTRNPQRRINFALGVAVEAELGAVQELAVATLAATPGVLAEPAPTCLVDGFGDSAMTLSLSAWVDQREADWFKVGSEARRRIKVAFDQAGIEVPEPIYRVRTHSLDVPAPAGPVQAGEALDRAVDISPDAHIEQRVEAERAEAPSEDLLVSDAPVE